MKKHISIILVLIMLFLFVPITVNAGEVTAAKVELTISVDGVNRRIDAYAIDNYNYFKLRDIAYVLSGTSKQFDVTWDGSKNAINLVKGKAYTVVGNELAMLPYWEETKTAVPNTSSILLDGKEERLTAYTIDGYNYFKLRDIASTFDFFVDWDNIRRTVIVETMFGYVPEDSSDSYSYKSSINVGDTQEVRINNWARVSPVQQFLYLGESLAYAYEDNDYLKIVTRNKELGIAMKYSKLGDVISDDDGNFFIVWGKDGTENTEQTVFISKYSSKGEHIKPRVLLGNRY